MLGTVNRVLSAMVVVGLLAMIGLWFYPELIRRNDMVATLEHKKAELAKEKALRKQREREKYLLENDPEYIESVARDRLDLMKEGETIFRLDVAEPAAQPASAAVPAASPGPKKR